MTMASEVTIEMYTNSVHPSPFLAVSSNQVLFTGSDIEHRISTDGESSPMSLIS